jgi:hypothetical protein
MPAASRTVLVDARAGEQRAADPGRDFGFVPSRALS